MTHPMHRQGTYSNLSDDFVVLRFPGREFDDLDARLRQFENCKSSETALKELGFQSWLTPKLEE